MHTFSCFSFSNEQVIPGLIFVVTDSLQRAREVARRELVNSDESLAIEIFEGNKLLWAGTQDQM